MVLRPLQSQMIYNSRKLGSGRSHDPGRARSRKTPPPGRRGEIDTHAGSGRLEGQAVIVTGASRGIGRAIALRLAEEGADLVLVARSRGALEGVAKEVASRGRDALPLRADLEEAGFAGRIVEKALARFKRIDALINNAGGGRYSPIEKTDPEASAREIRLNLLAVMELSRAVLQPMREAMCGAIVTISSILGKMGSANMAPYSAAKHGVIGFSESLFEEVREDNIKVSVICPGMVDTDFLPRRSPYRRERMIRPEDVAHAVLMVLTTAPTACPTEIVLRPQRTPYEG